MKIPKSFKLAGLTIDVSVDPTFFQKRSLLGEAQYPLQKIVLDGELHRESMQQNFLHELVHWILYVMNEDNLRDNEKFVDLFSALLHQTLISQEYPLEEGSTDA
jgi:hypothetical protein